MTSTRTTTGNAPVTSTSTSTSTSTGAARLLRLDGVLCAAMGGAMAIAPGPAADLLGTSATGVVRAVGIALTVYGAALLASAGTRRARAALRTAGVANLGWELASLAVAALAELSTLGRVLVAGQGLVVGALGVVQLRAVRR